jgi:thymidylate synthase (FAD)
MRKEYADDDTLRQMAEDNFDESAAKYDQIAQLLLARQGEGNRLLSGEKKRDLRKKVNQAARSYLPNHTEAPIGWTGNMRSWRHVGEMRGSEHAEVAINHMMIKVFLCLYMLDPIMYEDYSLVELDDGRFSVSTPYTKV